MYADDTVVYVHAKNKQQTVNYLTEALVHTSFTSWSQASTTVLKSIESLYKQMLKIFDQRTNCYHYCNIVHKHNVFSFDNIIHLVDTCLFLKNLNNYAPPPLCQFITQKNNNGRVTRAITRGDCAVQFSCTKFGQNQSFQLEPFIIGILYQLN